MLAVNSGLGFIDMLSKDKAVIATGCPDAALATMHGTNWKLLKSVIDSVVTTRSVMLELQELGTVAQAQGGLCRKLVKSVGLIMSCSRKHPKWTGRFREIGNELLQFADSVLISGPEGASEMLVDWTATVLEAYVHIARENIDKLKLVAGGTSDGSLWYQGVPGNPSKDAILTAFNDAGQCRRDRCAAVGGGYAEGCHKRFAPLPFLLRGLAPTPSPPLRTYDLIPFAPMCSRCCFRTF